MAKMKHAKDFLDIKLGKYYIFFRKRYKIVSMLNDLSTGILFLTGSILYLFDPPIQTIGNVFFILASFQLLMRPIIRIIHDSSLRHYSARYIKKPDKNQEKHAIVTDSTDHSSSQKHSFTYRKNQR
ncbi:YrhK family protein [Alteribacillus sp. HJP-4]|uniref:YrhK family protein n=1 Tax=Alteribacillus sp. HJP-4 TaxID=2775394 RepID=UPI0035CD2C24